MKIRTFDFPKFKGWYKTPKCFWEQRIGRYICSISMYELFKKRYYSIELVYKEYPSYEDHIYTNSIKINKDKKTIKKWYKQSIVKAKKAWKKEMQQYVH